MIMCLLLKELLLRKSTVCQDWELVLLLVGKCGPGDQESLLENLAVLDLTHLLEKYVRVGWGASVFSKFQVYFTTVSSTENGRA